MSRQPSIHITLSVLKSIIYEWYDMGYDKSQSGHDLANYILKRGSKYTLTHRKKLDNYDSNTKKKTDRLKSSQTEHAKIFASLLTKVRQQRKHRGVKTIEVSSKEWGIVKECTGNAINFCYDFNLPIREGFIVYLNIWMDLVDRGRLIINMLPSKHETICNIYQAKVDIEEDVNKDETEKAHDKYMSIIAEKTGLTKDYRKEPLNYVYFVYASKLAKHLGVRADQYIQAQFDGLSWANGIPAPSQLVTKNAETRLIRWMSENNIKASSSKNDPNSMSNDQIKSFWDKVKNSNNGDNIN